jgi:hypothetical protein
MGNSDQNGKTSVSMSRTQFQLFGLEPALAACYD